MNKNLIESISQLPISQAAKNQLPKFIEMLQGPDSLQCLVPVADNYLTILKLSGFENLSSVAGEFQPLASELVTKNNEICKHQKKIGHDGVTAFKSMARGIIRDYPLYSGLAFSYGSEQKVFLRLQQALFVGCYQSKKQGLNLTKNDIYSFNLLIRKITEFNSGQVWLDKIDIQSIDSFSALRHEFIVLEQSLLDEENELRQQFEVSHQFLDVLCDISVIRREAGPRTQHIDFHRKNLGIRGIDNLNQWETCTAVVLGDPDDDAEYPHVYSITQDITDEQLMDELQELDVEPSEIDSPTEWIYSRQFSIPTFAQAFQDKLRARGAVNAIESQNQYLMMSSQLLTDEDVQELFHTLNRKNAKQSNSTLCLIILGIFATSSHPDRIKNLNMVRGSEREALVFSENTIAYDLDSGSWLIGSLDLQFKNLVNDEAAECSIATDTHYIELPDLFGFGQSIRKLYGDEIPARPFAKNHKLSSKLRKLIKADRSRLTISRIQRYLTLLCAAKHEAAAASLVFTNHLPTASSRKFYTVLATDKIADIYAEIAMPVAKLVNLTANRTDHLSPMGFIGGRYLPVSEHISSVLVAMRSNLNAIRSDKADCWWVEYHNLYTVYCIYAQGLLTAYRAIRQPLLQTSDFVFGNTVAVLRDKDSEDQFHTRNIPCHELTYSFSEAYEKHLGKLIKRLPPLVVSNMSGITVFFIESDLSVTEARPKSINQYLKTFTPLPLNSNRKYIRKFLLDNNCSVHAIDTLLGHASRGENYWERYHTRGLNCIFSEIRSHMVRLINELDIQLVQGLLR